MQPYLVRKLQSRKNIVAGVPASKSILNRALLLASLAGKPVKLLCGELCDDTHAMLDCLRGLGVEIEEEQDGLTVCGTGFSFGGTVDVKSAGTVARFLPALAAFCGAKCSFVASEQMSRRPMSILRVLEEHGVRFQFLGEPYAFPFEMDASGLTGGDFAVDTAESTQYASALMLAACAKQVPTRIALRGPRTQGSYLKITKTMLEDFGATVTSTKDDLVTVLPPKEFPDVYTVEPDLSSACYLYALSLLCNAKVTVRGVKINTVQGDFRLLTLLREKGVRLYETEEGLCADGTLVPIYNGIDVDMRDFSDQAFTVAALALFASSPSILRGLGHTRGQESDRIQSIVKNVNALGSHCFSIGEDIFLEPAPVTGGTIETFGDHRAAMGFALVGLKTGKVVIDDPACSEKTFPNFFRLLDDITK